MKGFGIFILIVGICWMIFALNMDVSVSSGMGRVNNLGLMADRQVHAIVGGMIALAGLLMLIFGERAAVTNTQVSSEIDTRPCPLCAETIKNAAIKCKHCGADVEAVAIPPLTDRVAEATQDLTQQTWALTIPCRKESDRERAATTAEFLKLPSLLATDSFFKFGPYPSKTEAGAVLRQLTENGVHGNIEEIRKP